MNRTFVKHAASIVASVALGTLAWAYVDGRDDDASFLAQTEISIAALPTVASASKTKVIEIKQLLSPAEIDSLLAGATRVRSMCGRTGKHEHCRRLLLLLLLLLLLYLHSRFQTFYLLPAISLWGRS